MNGISIYTYTHTHIYIYTLCVYCVYTYNGTLVIKRECNLAICAFVTTCIDLEGIKLSEIRQTKTNTV